MRRLLSLLLAAAVTAACSSDGGDAPAASPPTSRENACPPIVAQIGDSGATILGGGTTGVVLAGQDRCVWWPFATRLTGAGARVVGLQLPAHGEPGALARDVAGAAALLRQQGATTVVLAGAGIGSAAGVDATALLKPGPDGLVLVGGADESRRRAEALPGLALLVVPGESQGDDLLADPAVADRIVRFVSERAR